MSEDTTGLEPAAGVFGNDLEADAVAEAEGVVTTPFGSVSARPIDAMSRKAIEAELAGLADEAAIRRKANENLNRVRELVARQRDELDACIAQGERGIVEADHLIDQIRSRRARLLDALKRMG